MMPDEPHKSLEALRRLADALPSADEEDVPDVDAALRAEGLDAEAITDWSNDLAQQVQGKLRLHAAGQKRTGIVEKMAEKVRSIGVATEELQEEIDRRMQALTLSKQGAFYRKLKKVSSEQDLRSLLEDLEMLEELEGDEESQ